LAKQSGESVESVPEKKRIGWKGFVEKEGFRNERVRGDG